MTISGMHQSRQSGHVLLWLLAIAGILFGAILLALPIAIEWTAEDWMRAHLETDFEIDDIDFNPFTGRIVISYANAGADETRLLELGDGNTWINWLPLLDKRISLGELSLKDALIDLHIDDTGRTTIAGLEIPDQAEQAKETKAAGWQIGFGPVNFENVVIAIDTPIAKQTVVIHKLHIDTLATWEADAGADIEIELSASGGTARMTGKIYPFSQPLRLVGDLDIDDMLFEEMPEVIALMGLQRPSGKVSIEGKIDLTRGALATDLVSRISGKGFVENLEFVRPQLRQLFHYGRGEFTGKLVFDYATGMTAELSVVGEDLSVTDDELKLDLIQIEHFTVTEAKYNGINDIRAKQFHARNLNLLEQESDEENLKHYDLTVSELIIEPIALSLERLNIGDLEMKGIQGSYSVVSGLFSQTQAGQVGNTGSEDETATQAVDDDAATPGSNDASFLDNYNFSAGHILIHDNSQFTFIDSTVDPPVEVLLDEFEFELGSLTTKNPDKSSDMRIDGKIGKYSTFNITGKLFPEIDTPTGSINGKIRSLDLSPFSGYVKAFLGYKLISGSLDADIQADIKDEKLVANADIKANRLRMEELPAEQRPPDNDAMDIPIGTALALLRDKDDNIELNIPIEGDLSDLEIGLGDAIGQAVGSATMKTMETTVMVLYAPLGIFKLIGTIAGSAGKLRFHSIEFAPGDATLDDTDITYLNEVIAMLGKKEDVRLSVCGLATPADYLATEGSEKESAILIARQRGDTVKDYLVEQGNISPERLFVCSPEVDVAQDAQPRVELSI